MSTENEQTTAEGVDVFETANDRFKRSFGSWFWGSMVAATLVHFMVLAFWPNLTASDFSFVMDDIVAIDLPPEIEIPPPPEQIQRPANPVVTDAQIDEDITIAPTTFEDNLPDDLPPPREEGAVDISDQPTFTPFTVAPEVRNRQAVGRALEREYPSLLRDAGIGGTVLMHFFINETGELENVLVAESSGHQALDDAALRVAQVFEFTPAMNRDQQVPVWIQIPVTFQTR
ncbi:MAG: energy transducer TonB [Gemmatimonadales bacterium]|jgi:protein TonB|nr:MAG: energy transducer TonB [Gemmatimonadales bacterium]